MEFMPDAAFEVNEPTVISETIDGETVIINLASGSYYSLKRSGATIWSGIQKSARLDDIAAMIRAAFTVGEEPVEGEIADLVGRLVEEDLIRPAGASARLAPGGTVEGFVPAPFQPPLFEKFTDMEAMLLLDPVHDVDDEGWPHMPGGDGQANG